MKLRAWQTDCSNKALQFYRSENKHFFCLASPGAGKSIMAAEVAKRLYNDGLIENILCFSPSTTVAYSLQLTFSKYLDTPFKGGLGDLGASMTYQSLPYLPDHFWTLLEKRNVLVIFDEIHHCAGGVGSESNVWGHCILKNIQSKASYTLSLSGTPWRTDHLPITLAQYNDRSTQVDCHYQYGLKAAINDGVCRIPNIILVDNDRIDSCNDKEVVDSFSSVELLLKSRDYSYRNIISNKEALRHVLSRGCGLLSTLREKVANAGGLVVASSIVHAQQIYQMLIEEFGQTACMVSYLDSDAQEIIDAFKNSQTHWIVAIGMISEGTDIPRLQVCCHLSSIKTELYFRQVLGRVLRMSENSTQDAWLITFNETSLRRFAKGVAEEIPEYPMKISLEGGKQVALTKPTESSHNSSFTDNNEHPRDTKLVLSSFVDEAVSGSPRTARLNFLGKYKEELLCLF